MTKVCVLLTTEITQAYDLLCEIRISPSQMEERIKLILGRSKILETEPSLKRFSSLSYVKRDNEDVLLNE